MTTRQLLCHLTAEEKRGLSSQHLEKILMNELIELNDSYEHNILDADELEECKMLLMKEAIT